MRRAEIEPLLLAVLVAGAACADKVYAQRAEPSGAADSARALRELVERQDALIERLVGRIDELESRVLELEAETGSDRAGASGAAIVADRAGAGNEDDDDEPLLELTEEERREQERLVRTAFQQTLIERGGLLLPPGSLDVEASLAYTHSSAENIVIDGFTILPVLVVGDIVSEKVHRDMLQTSATVRVGLPWDSQLDVRLPFGYQRQRSFSADGVESTTSASELGDVTLGYSRQLTRSNGRWPDFLASLRWKTTTGTGPFDLLDGEDAVTALGTGYDSLNLSVTGIKVVDPVVYFGSVNYSINYARDEEIGRYDPGDSIGLSLGMAVALNLNSSLSFAYEQQFTRRARLDGAGVPGSYLTTGIFSVGGSFAVSDTLSADFSVGIGVTQDSPDLQLAASFPFRLRY